MNPVSPLQLGLKQLVEENGGDWKVLVTEYPWRDPLYGDEKVIDVILTG